MHEKKARLKKTDIALVEPPPDMETYPWRTKVYTLGEFKIIISGKEFIFTKKIMKKPVEILKALVAFGGKNVPEELVTDAVWPDSEGDASRASLKFALHQLRKLLGSNECIEVKGGRLSLNPRCCYLDVKAFLHIVDEIKDLLPPLTQHDIRLAENAIGLYKGNFLKNDSCSWAVPLRERLKVKFIHLIDIVGGYYEGNEQWDKAIEQYEHALDTDDLQEEYYGRIIRCLHRLERLTEATAVYRRCCNVLNARLGAAPSPAMKSLFNSLQNKLTN